MLREFDRRTGFLAAQEQDIKGGGVKIFCGLLLCAFLDLIGQRVCDRDVHVP